MQNTFSTKEIINYSKMLTLFKAEFCFRFFILKLHLNFRSRLKILPRDCMNRRMLHLQNFL